MHVPPFNRGVALRLLATGQAMGPALPRSCSAPHRREPRSLSTSGNDCSRPLRGGHSISNVLLRIAFGSRSPSSANAVTTLPPACRTSPKKGVADSAARPSPPRTRAGTRPADLRRRRYSPLGIDQAPASFFMKKGPPGWTRRTSSLAGTHAIEEQSGASLRHRSPPQPFASRHASNAARRGTRRRSHLTRRLRPDQRI